MGPLESGYELKRIQTGVSAKTHSYGFAVLVVVVALALTVLFIWHLAGMVQPVMFHHAIVDAPSCSHHVVTFHRVKHTAKRFTAYPCRFQGNGKPEQRPVFNVATR